MRPVSPGFGRSDFGEGRLTLHLLIDRRFDFIFERSNGTGSRFQNGRQTRGAPERQQGPLGCPRNSRELDRQHIQELLASSRPRAQPVPAAREPKHASLRHDEAAPETRSTAADNVLCAISRRITHINQSACPDVRLIIPIVPAAAGDGECTANVEPRRCDRRIAVVGRTRPGVASFQIRAAPSVEPFLENAVGIASMTAITGKVYGHLVFLPAPDWALAGAIGGSPRRPPVHRDRRPCWLGHKHKCCP